MLACDRRPPREIALDQLVRNVVVRDVKEVAVESERLESALSLLERQTTRSALVAARKAWKAAAIAWKRAYCFRAGPIVDTSALLRAAHWPARAKVVNATWRETNPIGDRTVDELGVDRKGVYALEHLLFGLAPSDDAIWGEWSNADNRRLPVFASALGRDVARYARAAASKLGDGGAFATAFAGRGQDSVNVVVNGLIENVETLCEERLAPILGMSDAGLFALAYVEGHPSGTSRELALAVLDGTERLYTGADAGGLAEVVNGLSPALHRRLVDAFAKAVSALQALPGPLEVAVKQRRPLLEVANKAVKELEIALKAELVSVLGVTLTFTTMDGE
jgi:predicted lipoprotein